MEKIAIVCKIGNSLEYDDRIRKECLALKPYYDCFVYVNFDDNRVEKGVTSYGVPYQSIHLQTRDTLPSHRIFLPIKGLEFYSKVRRLLEGYDYIWCVEEITTLIVLFYKKDKCIWDLHEVPTMLTGSKLKRWLFRTIEKKCHRLIHANEERLDYLKSLGMVRHPERHFVVHNYPDDTFLNSKQENAKNENVKSWLNGMDYVYLQGLTMDERYPFNTIYALLQASNLKILVVGGLKDTVMEKLRAEYQGDIGKRLLSIGCINSLEMTSLIRPALFSVIFYNYDDPNCRYCEANRFYNAIALGVPVIVGANDTMKNVCDKYGIGVCIKTDGRDIADIALGIKSLEKNLFQIKENCRNHSGKYKWNCQDVIQVLQYQ